MSSKDENENDETLMSSKDENKNETMNQNNNIIKELNGHLNEIIDKSKSFKDQIRSIRKVENVNEFYFINDYGDKELEFKIFKLKLAHLSNIIDKKLLKQIFGHAFETLANKLINTTNKKENQMIFNNINKSKEKRYKQDETSAFYELCKMYLISAEGYENANVDFLTMKTTSEICWKDVRSGMGVKNISDLVLKEIYGICKTKNPTKKQVNEYKMTERNL